jgi:hypothetical protein
MLYHSSGSSNASGATTVKVGVKTAIGVPSWRASAASRIYGSA